MISVVQHGLRGSELLGRKFRSMRARLEPDALSALEIDEVDVLVAGSDAFVRAPKSGVLILVSGVVGEVRVLKDGRRQIVALRLPGDILAPVKGEIVVALTRARVADGASLMARLADASDAYQPLRRAWLAAGRTDQAILRDQVVRLGRMSAFERMAHIFLEAHERLAQVGLAVGVSFHLPLTQQMISDVVGLSVVHLNRTLQLLRRGGLVTARHGYVTLVDRAQLVEIASYVSRFPVAWEPCEPAARGPLQQLAG